MDTERGTRDRKIAAVAKRQHGVIALRQLLALGVGAALVRRWVANGRLHPIHRGVYAVGHPVVAPKGRLLAAVLACGPATFISHRTAAQLWGLLDDSRAVIDVVAAANRRSRKGIAFHRVRQLHPDDCAEIDHIPVTSVARTLLDIAPVIPVRRLTYALEQAEKEALFDMVAIEAVMGRCHGHNGLGRLRQAITEIEPEAQYTHKGLERLFVAFCRRYELEQPAMNAVVEGFTVDALWPTQKLIVELDSWEHHKGRRAFEEDRRRDLVLTAAGYRILRVTKRRLEHDAEQLATLLSASRPSPAATA
jgi:very-short-patch-repair endonuclease